MYKMSSPKLEEEGVLREWAPLSKLLQQIPMRLRHGMFFEEVKFTCVDATLECIVLGTNCGTIFWYDRSSHYVQQLRLEKGANAVTSVKVVSTVDFMVAAGDSSGIVSIYKIPKSMDGNTFVSNLAEKIERYTIDGLHKSKVTALDWSINGQKLFSGDADGIVVFTEMDFVMNLSKAREIVNEKYPIVQLSYHQREQVLVISSELRCIIWRNQNTGPSVTQIGQKERSSLLPLGATFVCDPMSGDLSIYSCRGGLKLWKADLDGNVQYTLLFKDALKKCNNSVKLLKTIESVEKQGKQCEFGKLFSWRDGLFVSYTKNNIVIVDPTQVAVASKLINAKEIMCVSPTRTELFLITGPRDVIRLGYTPDLYDSSLGGFGNMAKAEYVSGLPDVNLQPVIGSPLSTSYTWNTYLSASTANSEPSSSEVNYGQDPVALPPIVSIHDGVPELRVELTRYQQYTTVGQQGFDDIIYSQKRLQKHKNRRKSAEFSEPKSKSIGISLNGVATYFNNIGKFLNGEFSPSICDGELENKLDSVPKSVMPDMRDLNAIVEDVARKEMLLDAMLESSFRQEENPIENGGIIDINSSPCSSVESSSSNNIENASRKIFEIELEKPESIDVISNNLKILSTNVLIQPSILSPFPQMADSKSDNKRSGEHTFEQNIMTLPMSDSLEVKNNNITKEEVDKPEINLEIEKKIESEIKNVIEPQIKKEIESQIKNEAESDIKKEIEPEMNNEINTDGISYEDYMTEIPLTKEENFNFSILDSSNPCSEEFPSFLEDTISKVPKVVPFTITKSQTPGWYSMSCPDCPVSVSSWKEGLVMCTPRLKVYVSNVTSWSELSIKAQNVIASSTGELGIKMFCSQAHYSVNWMNDENWKKIIYEVQHAAVLNEEIWFISKGELFVNKLNESASTLCAGQTFLTKVYSFNNGPLVLSENGRIFMYSNKEWKIIRGIKNAKLLSVGPQQLIWVVDLNNILYVSRNIKVENPIWWQVPIVGTKLYEVLSICSTVEGVYLSFKNDSSLLFNKTCVTGHRWAPASLNLECTQITAAGVFEEKGSIWVLEKSNKLFALNSSLKVVKEVIPPCNVVCIASAPGALWLLSDEGSVYLRQGISDGNPVGINWRKLDLEQLHSQVEFVSISCGPDAVWACDIRGKIVMLVGSPHSIANDTFNPAWVYVDGKPIDNNTFSKVYVGPDTYMVWALDSAGNIYVREAVFPTFPLGTGWVHVSGIKASHITISSDAVYALTGDGVYKRVGISQSNYIGDVWLYLPVKLDYISASFDLGLFGVCSKSRNLVSHIEREFPMSEHITVEKDWELL